MRIALGFFLFIYELCKVFRYYFVLNKMHMYIVTLWKNRDWLGICE